jgi:nicotinamidase-related amidase
MKLFFKKSVLLALVTALGLASLPLVNVFAAGQKDPTTPPQTFLTNDKLELVWAHQLRVYKRMGRIDQLIERAQKLIDRAKENGKDVSAVQAALDAFETQWKAAKPTYESIKGIVSSHQGFDDNGKVTDTEKAKATVMEMRGKFKEIHDTLNGTGKALHEAIKAFREANPRPQVTATP